jgi:hypothetical protein
MLLLLDITSTAYGASVKLVRPVPPLLTGIAVPFQAPLVIVPTVVMLALPVHDARLLIIEIVMLGMCASAILVFS